MFNSFKPDVKKVEKEKDVEGLIEALRYEDNYYVRIAAAKALGEIGDKRAVEPLIGALKDEAAYVEIEAAIALGKIGDIRAADHLVSALKSRYGTLQLEAAKSLGKMGWKPKNSAEMVSYLMAKGPRLMINEEWDDLKDAGEPAIQLLVQVLTAGNWFDRWKAAEMLGEIGGETAHKALTEALETDENETVRKYIKEALEKTKARAISASPQVEKCPSCGVETPVGAEFCPSCGRRLQ